MCDMENTRFKSLRKTLTDEYVFRNELRDA